MADRNVTITIEAIDQATAAFEEVEQASSQTGQAIQSSWEESEAASQAYAQGLYETAGAHQEIEQASIETGNAIEEGWSGAAMATDDYEHSLDSVMASKEEMGAQSEGVLATMEDNLFAVGVAGAAMSAGIQGATMSAQDAEVVIGRLSTVTGYQTEELRDLTRSLTDATLAYGEVAEVMETGTQMGLRSEEQLKNFVETWDLVADATGENITKLAEGSTVLRALGVSAEEPEVALDALGYVAQNTNLDITEFLSSIRRLAPELSDMNMGIDETVAVFGALEASGTEGRTAIQEIRQAVNESDGSFKGLLNSLDLTEEQFQSYMNELEGGEDILRQNAAHFKDTRTFVQELKASFEGIMGSLYPVLGALSNLVAPLALLGPAIKGVTLAKTKLAGATVALTGAKTALLAVVGVLASPFLLVAAAVTAVIAIFILFGDEIKWLAGLIKDTAIGAFKSLIETVRDIIPRVKDAIVRGIGAAIDFLKGIPRQFYEMGTNMISSLVKGITDSVRNAVRAVRDSVGGIVSAAKRAIGMNSPAKEFIDIGESMGEGMEEGLKKMDRDLLRAGEKSATVAIQGAGGQQSQPSTIAGNSGSNDSYNITQNIEINSPQPMDEKKVRQENDKMMREVAINYATGR